MVAKSSAKALFTQGQDLSFEVRITSERYLNAIKLITYSNKLHQLHVGAVGVLAKWQTLKQFVYCPRMLRLGCIMSSHTNHF